MSTEQMCIEARQRVATHINRSAGQHARAMKAPAPAAPTSAEIFCMCMESDMSDQYARWLCHAAGVAFPPVNQ